MFRLALLARYWLAARAVEKEMTNVILRSKVT